MSDDKSTEVERLRRLPEHVATLVWIPGTMCCSDEIEFRDACYNLLARLGRGDEAGAAEALRDVRAEWRKVSDAQTRDAVAAARAEGARDKANEEAATLRAEIERLRITLDSAQGAQRGAVIHARGVEAERDKAIDEAATLRVRLTDLTIALQQIANLYPPDDMCAQKADECYGINDGKHRAILLKAALDVARAALRKETGQPLPG